MGLTHKSVEITERSSIGEARRTALQAAQALGFDEEQRSNLGIAVTEAATNILLHAQKGEMLICPFSDGDSAWVDLLALDLGPGIADLQRAMEDGFSTIGTAGQGLGAIQRLAAQSSVYSVPGKGTVSWSRFQRGNETAAMNVGLVNLPLRGENGCGDACFLRLGPEVSVYMVVDGLGHGKGAEEAATEAVKVLESAEGEPLAEVLRRTHDALRQTRGAAMMLAMVNHAQRTVTYAGVGNVTATLTTAAGTRSLVSQNGTLGAAMPRIVQEYTNPLERNTTLTMFSDGLTSKTSTVPYPGLSNRHPALIAGVLFRDFSRKRDDATVLVAPLPGVPA